MKDRDHNSIALLPGEYLDTPVSSLQQKAQQMGVKLHHKKKTSQSSIPSRPGSGTGQSPTRSQNRSQGPSPARSRTGSVLAETQDSQLRRASIGSDNSIGNDMYFNDDIIYFFWI